MSGVFLEESSGEYSVTPSVLQSSATTLRVANIVLDGRFGGPQNRILQVAERLRNYGIETVVVMPEKNSETFCSKLVEKNIAFRKLSLHRLTRHRAHLIGWLFCFIPELISICNFLKREDIRAVHCNTPWQIKGVLAGKMTGTKIVWHLNNTELPRLMKMLFNVLAHFCDNFIVAGERVKQFYFNGKWIRTKRIIEIQAPVDTSYMNPDSVMKDEILGNSPGIKITTVGTINRTKRIEDFIAMANTLNGRYKEDLQFYVVGPYLDSQKNYSERLTQLIKDFQLENVSFYGPSNNVASILKATDIYVCMSETEASPMAVWEAMAMEKAIVSTDVGDVKTFIKNGENGFVVPPKDVEALAEKVGILIEDENLRVRFGKLARAIAVKELDIDICADKHRSLYLEVLNTERRS